MTFMGENGGMKKSSKFSASRHLVLSLMFSGMVSVMAQTALPTVNGEPLSAALYEQRMQAAMARGQTDSPQLRDAVLQDLINRHLLLKEAQRRGADKDADFQKKLSTVRDELLVDWFVQKHSDPATIAEAELKAEYDRQVQALGPAADLKEYRLGLIMLATKEDAGTVVRDLQKGVAFDKLAREKSVDPSREQGGQLGWVLPQLITPTVASVMANLAKGSHSVAPIETPAGWAVIRVEDVRPYKVPTLQDSRQQLINAVVMRKRTELIQGLRSTAAVRP